jgi:hypothetical protein
MALEGDLRLFQLPDMLQVVNLQKKTGILTVQGEQDIIAISFLGGAVVAADALNQSVEDGLGQVLAAERWVMPDQFSAVVAEHHAGGERLVDLLLARGLLDRERLLAALRKQTYRLLLLALRWREGEFKFYAGEEVSYEEGFEPIAVDDLLGRAVEDLAREWLPGAGAAPRASDRFERLPFAGAIRVLGRDGETPTEDPGEVWISGDDARVLMATEGRASVGEVAAELGLAPTLALFAYLRLARGGLVRLRPEVDAPAPPLPAPAAVPAGGAGEGTSELLAEVELASAEELARAEASEAVQLRRIAAIVAGALAALLLFAAVRFPLGISLPFPWQAETREQAARLHRAAAAQGIDRAARAHYLLDGRYPEGIGELVRLGLLAAPPRDPAGRPWELRAQEVSYRLQPRGAGPLEAVAEGITGDILLDPEFATLEAPQAERALVLLD